MTARAPAGTAVADRLYAESAGVACMLCKAPPGTPCHTVSGRRALLPHAARLDVARGRKPNMSYTGGRNPDDYGPQGRRPSGLGWPS